MEQRNLTVTYTTDATIPIDGERNLLEVIRKAGIDLPTFCYHSELSVYGACRLCLVEIEGTGVVTSCSTPPEAGHEGEDQHRARSARCARSHLELLLANHDQRLPDLRQERRLPAAGAGHAAGRRPRSASSRPTSASRSTRRRPSLVRDPNKCILCGDCVRMCDEIQGIGAIDFAYRGAATSRSRRPSARTWTRSSASTAASAPASARPARSRSSPRSTRSGRR